MKVLSRILNKYFSEQIAIVTKHGGDIIKFAGDALMAMWEENLVSSKRSTILKETSKLTRAIFALYTCRGKADARPLACLRAAQSALELQKLLNHYDTSSMRADDRTGSFGDLTREQSGALDNVLHIKIS